MTIMMMILAMVLRWRCTQHEFWKWASKSKCLNWSFQPADLNVSPSKCLRKIAHDLHSHNFRPLSDRIEVLRKRSANLNIRGLFAQLEIELPRCWGKNHPVHAMQCRSYKCKWCSCFWSATSSTFPLVSVTKIAIGIFSTLDLISLHLCEQELLSFLSLFFLLWLWSWGGWCAALLLVASPPLKLKWKIFCFIQLSRWKQRVDDRIRLISIQDIGSSPRSNQSVSGSFGFNWLTPLRPLQMVFIWRNKQNKTNAS